jgi:uncharacterized protein (DUF362 family)
MGNRVAVYNLTEAIYPEPESFYAPSQAYPEYPFAGNVSERDNQVYHAVRESFKLLGMDEAHIGTSRWNPFSGYIRPGDTVVLKPNMVMHYSLDGQNDMEILVTNGSVVRAVLDFVFLTIGQTGKVVVCDAPHGMADFQEISEFMHLPQLKRFYADYGYQLDYYDLRKVVFPNVFNKEIYFYPKEANGDPNGYRTVALDKESVFHGLDISWDCLTGASRNRAELHRHHNKDTHEYFVAQTILNADFFISLPKLKTHKKCGVTLNLKNLVGINGNKNYLPHQVTFFGRPKGWIQDMVLKFRNFMADTFLGNWGSRNIVMAYVCLSIFLCYSTIARFFALSYRKIQFWKGEPETPTGTIAYSGNSAENDILWRMVLDLNIILQYADKDGRLNKNRQRRLFSVIDGVLGGEGKGPLSPMRKESGIVIAGEDLLLVDGVATSIMGFDFQKLKLLREAVGRSKFPLGDYDRYEDVDISSNEPMFQDLPSIKEHHLEFQPPPSWDHIRLLKRKQGKDSGLTTNRSLPLQNQLSGNYAG